MDLVALEWGIRLDAWDRMTPEYQARHIAVSRAKGQMRAILDHYSKK